MPSLFKSAWVKLFAVFFWLAGCAGSGSATTVVIPSDEDLIIGARAIVMGKVISISSGFDNDRSAVYTYVTLQVEEVLKGGVTKQSLMIKEPGGEFGDYGQIVYGSPQFAPGEEVLLYLDTWPDGSLRVHQMCLGKFSIIREKDGLSVVVRSGLADRAGVVGKSSAGNVTDQMELRAYTEMVHSQVAATLEKSRKFEALHYKNVPMLMRPPDYDRRQMSGAIQPQFETYNPGWFWFEPTSGRPVRFLTNPEGAPYPSILSDVAAAMNAWSTAPGVSLNLMSGGETTQCSSSVGSVLLTFNNCDGTWSPSPGCSGILARAQSWYTTSESRAINGKPFYRITRASISLNPYASCYFSSHCNVQEVITHEIGHTLGLNHTGDISLGYPTPAQMDATMYPIIHFDNRCASLRNDDVGGIAFLYPAAPGVSGPAITTGTPLSSAAMGDSYTQKLGVAGGISPYDWGLAPGSSLPPGISLSPDGLLTGIVSATGDFNFTIQVIDAASRAARKELSISVTDAPRIKSVKYKPKKMQLVLKGERLQSVVLLIDKRQVECAVGSNSVVADAVALTTGAHEIRVVNSNGVPSDLFILQVK